MLQVERQWSESQIRGWNINIPLLNIFSAIRGANTYVPFLTALLLAAQFSNIGVMFFTVFGYFIGAVPEILTGYFADQYKRKFSLAGGAAFCCISMLLLACVGLFGPMWVTYGLAFFAAALLYIGQSLVSGADLALQHDSLRYLGRADETEHRDGRAKGFYGLSEALNTFLLGGLGWLAGMSVNLRVIMLVQAAIFLAGVIVALCMTETPRQRHTLRLGEIMRACWRIRPITSAICLLAAISSLSAALVWLTPLYYLAYSGLKIGSGDWGWVYNIVWGLYLGSVMLFTLKFGKHTFSERLRRLPYFGLVHCIVGIAVCYLGVSLSHVVVGMVCIGATYFVRATAIPIANTLLRQELTKAGLLPELATIMSVARTLLWTLTMVSFGAGIAVLSLGGSVRQAITATEAVIITFAAFACLWAIKQRVIRKVTM